MELSLGSSFHAAGGVKVTPFTVFGCGAGGLPPSCARSAAAGTSARSTAGANERMETSRDGGVIPNRACSAETHGRATPDGPGGRHERREVEEGPLPRGDPAR